ncbi:MAG: nuclease (SNase domain protein) [Deltaproteobacteria bacterium]|nr:nuclease (SNase domain protein) [Deltaproteobacteria bacterium]
MGSLLRRGEALTLLAAFVFSLSFARGGLLAAETAVVEEVPDGDTLRVLVGGASETVRLIGIDAPERSHPTVGREYHGDESAALLSSLCLGKTVRMEAGDEDRDRYDRLLRFVFLPPPDGRLLNLEMIRAGAARAYTKYPFPRRDEFLAAENLARREGKGLWKDGGAAEARWLVSGKGPRAEVYPSGGGTFLVVHKGWARDGVERGNLSKEIDWVLKARAESSDAEFARRARERGYRPVDPAGDIPAPPAGSADAADRRGGSAVSWEEAHRHVDERIVVEGTIVRTHRTASVLYLNFHPNWKRYLTVVIRSKDLPLFPADPETAFKGRKIRARGEVTLFKGRLEMVVRDPADIVVVP